MLREPTTVDAVLLTAVGKAVLASYVKEASYFITYYRVAVVGDVDIITVNGKLPDADLPFPKVRLALSCSFSGHWWIQTRYSYFLLHSCAREGENIKRKLYKWP